MFTPLMTDRYEFSMLQTFIAEGMVDKKVTFDVFTRRLTPGYRYGVFAGLGRLLPMLEKFSFPTEMVAELLSDGVVDALTADYLTHFSFKGSIRAYREGEIYFPNSPVLSVEATLGEAVLVETLILSVLNFDSGIASKAARITEVARGSKVIEMGSRRTHEEAAVAAARAAYIAGFAATSNLAAAKQFGVPTAGTAAHAFTLAFGDEQMAFEAQILSHGAGTTLLIDTYDVEQGARNAVAAAKTYGAEGPGAVRIDSGDLAANARLVRKVLDELGAADTKITVTSDLDEHVIKDLLYQNAPIDGYGVGTKLVAAPGAGFVYKMVEIETEAESGVAYMRPVAKKSKDKVSHGGRKTAYRLLNANGEATTELVLTSTHGLVREEGTYRALQTLPMVEGVVTDAPSLDTARDNFTSALEELPEGERSVWSGTDHGPFLTAEVI